MTLTTLRDFTIPLTCLSHPVVLTVVVSVIKFVNPQAAVVFSQCYSDSSKSSVCWGLFLAED